jgi:CelD/BcsL family acetyltransferase involved in cellulose biosynthesis
MTTVRKIDTADEFDRLKPVWKTLVAQTDTDNVFLTFEWNRSWWRVYGQSHRLYLLVVASQGRIIGLAPFMVTESTGLTGTKKLLRFTSTPDADYSDFIGKDKQTICERVIGYLFEHRKDWTTIRLSQIPDSSSTLPILNDILSKEKYPWRCKAIEECLEYVYDGPEDERANFAFRKGHSFRNARNFFNRGAGLQTANVTETATVLKRLPELFHLHISRWRGTTVPSKFLDSQHRSFFLELARSFAPNGMFLLRETSTGNLPVTRSIVFPYHRTVYHYTLAYNPYFSKRSPGQLHAVLQSEELIRNGYKLDFSRGAGEYKALLSNREKCNFEVTITRSRLTLAVARWYDAAKQIAWVRRLMSSRRLMHHKAVAAMHYAESGISGLTGRMMRQAVQVIADYQTYLVCEHRHEPETGVSIPEEMEIEQQTIGLGATLRKKLPSSRGFVTEKNATPPLLTAMSLPSSGLASRRHT